MAHSHRILTTLVTLIVVSSLAVTAPALADGKKKGSPHPSDFHFVHLYDKASPVLN